MRNNILNCLFFFLSFSVFSQNVIKVTPLVKRTIPNTISYKGNLKIALKWTDKLGENILITTETGSIENPIYEDDDYKDSEIYAYHFLNKYNTYEPTWTVNDFEKKCSLDVSAQFIPNSLQITDLNNNGIAEIWLVYKTNCTSDVSPFNLKIIMYEGNIKYTIRGKSKVQIGENEFVGGKYQMDKALYKADKKTKDFAKKLWEDNVIQSFN